MSCVFCDVIAGRIPSKKILETESLFAFSDIRPAAPTHILFVPKKHIDGIAEAKAADRELLGELCLAAADTARTQKLDKGYRLVFNSGADGGQTVNHLHLHLLGGRGLAWPPG